MRSKVANLQDRVEELETELTQERNRGIVHWGVTTSRVSYRGPGLNND